MPVCFGKAKQTGASPPMRSKPASVTSATLPMGSEHSWRFLGLEAGPHVVDKIQVGSVARHRLHN